MEHDAQISALLAGVPQSANALGQAAAPITLEYFGDLQCPFCRDFSLGVLPSIIQRWVRDGTLRVEYRALETATRACGPGSTGLRPTDASSLPGRGSGSKRQM